jgi:Hint domain
MAILTVGPGQQYSKIASAVAAANPGDTVDVQAGIYTNDFVSIFQNLTLQAVGGPVQMVDTLPANSTPINKAIIDEGGPGISVTINGFDISGAVVADGNGAAVRYEGGSLTLNNDYFHNNQDGMLAAADPNGTITINHSEFAFNGAGDGITHNLYVNEIALLTITDSYFHDVNMPGLQASDPAGHEIKSRAEDTVITNSRIFDLNSGASYSIDLPNGGNATITNNVIEQGPNTQNPYIIAYGEEGNLHAGTSVTIANNVIINDLTRSPFLSLNRTGIPLTFQNNQIYGLTQAEVDSGPLNESGTTFLTTEPTLNTASTWSVGIGAVCFLKGTRIATSRGKTRVEGLAIGDVVQTVAAAARAIPDDLGVLLAAGHLSTQPVKWIGHRRIDLCAHPRPETVAPIRILRDAFADGMPHRDLVVSPDHAIFVDGKLICARQLVNGTTIRQELDWATVDYYHVELDQHAILLAEGLPAESYIDTGNRGFFANSGAPMVLHPDLTDEIDYPTREAGSCAPFVWDEASVRPVWQRLFDRAAAIGLPVSQRTTTTEADLRLLADRRTVKPVSDDSDRVVFVLPRGVPEVRLLSSAQSPTEARPWLEDRRRLGVRVKRIVLRGADETCEVPVDHPDLTRGWWAIERDGQMMSRWTDGEAVLPLPAMSGHVMLEIYLAGSMTYAVDAAPEAAPARLAAA